MSLPGSDHTGDSGWEGKGPGGQQPLDLWRGLDRTKVWYVAQRPGLGFGADLESEGFWEPPLTSNSRENDILPIPWRGV